MSIFRVTSHNRTPSLPSPTERTRWRSATLQWWCVPLLLLFELILIIAIAVLFYLSQKWTGFVEVGFEDTSADLSSLTGVLELGQGLLWTALPVFIIGLYKIFRDATVAALIVETPYIELARSDAKTVEARQSVYLDYRTSFTIVAWWKAWKNKHYFLSICLVLTFVESLGLVPLTARIFATRGELLPRESPINVLSRFDSSAPLANADYGALMDAVSASWINESPLPRGTDGEYAFSRLLPPQALGNFTISAPVNASRLTVDCQNVPASSAQFTTADETDNIFTVSFSGTDRGCAIEGSIAANADSNDFLEAVLTDDCSEAAGRSRISLFYGSLSTTGNIENPLLISCIVSYWSASGTLTVVTTNNTFSGQVVEAPRFDAGEHKLEDLNLIPDQIERGIMTVQTFNPATSSAGNTNAPLRLAELVARRINAIGVEYTAETLINAIRRIYPAIYTMLVLTYFYPELATPIEVSGTLAIPQNRLHVVPPVAIAVLVILAVLLSTTVYLILYLRRHPSILAEEPIGLVGAAKLLRDSNIPDIVAKYHGRDAYDPQTPQKLAYQHLDDALKKCRCWIRRGERPCEVIIEMEEPTGVSMSQCNTSQGLNQNQVEGTAVATPNTPLLSDGHAVTLSHHSGQGRGVGMEPPYAAQGAQFQRRPPQRQDDAAFNRFAIPRRPLGGSY